MHFADMSQLHGHAGARPCPAACAVLALAPYLLACPAVGQRLAGSDRASALRGTLRPRRCYHRLPVH